MLTKTVTSLLITSILVCSTATTYAEELAKAAQAASPETASSVLNNLANPQEDYLSHLRHFLSAPTTRQDIDPKYFADFWLKWPQVTTRFKPDGEELRFVYANKIATDALAKGTYPFPEGAVLAKIGARAIHDPIFDSSLVPGQVQRVQIMLKKANDPNARDGWVYSLYTPGNRYVGHLEKPEIDACQACHQAARTRDMVFSQPFPNFSLAHPAPSTDTTLQLQRSFTNTALSKLPRHVQNLVVKEAPDVQSVMYSHLPAFSGTLFEARELIENFARAKNKPYVMTSSNSDHILIALPQEKCVAMTSSDFERPVVMHWQQCTQDSGK